jgi:16S rRNA (cytosine1402-N4)-methyltransferase
MNRRFAHEPVMATEVVALLAAAPDGVLVDATLGGGGHARAVLAAHPGLRLVGIDQDTEALAAAESNLAPFADRIRLVHARFDELADVVRESVGQDSDGPVTAILFDLGVSSWQLDAAERGFSYRHEAPLDMRMDRSRGRTAAELVNTEDERTLAQLFAANGEGKFARRIAGRIVAARPIQTTTELAEVVRNAIPAATRRTGGHPAKRVFQAIRIAVNDELDILAGAIDAAVEVLAPGGRLAVLAYHSGEDRIVKARLREAVTGGCTCPPQLPCVCGAVPLIRLLTRGAQKPTAEEVAANPRAESARLRAAERLQAPDPATAPEHDTKGNRR